MHKLTRLFWMRWVQWRVALLVLAHLSLSSAKCVNWCSQHGLCIGTGEDAYCDCEIGYAGAGCERRICPKADDPMTKNQNFREIRLTTTAVEGKLSGVLGFYFHGEQTFFDANGTRFDGKACAKAVQRLPNIAEVSCSRGNVTEVNGATYLISIRSWPIIPHQNNLYEHDGNPSLSAFSCDVSQTEGGLGAECLLADVINKDVKEYVECSMHGQCDSKTGICDCELGFHGLACEDITDNVDALVAYADGPFFTASVLHVRARRQPSSEFQLIRASAGKTDVLTLSGSGALVHSGTVSVAGAASLNAGLVEVGAQQAAVMIKPSKRQDITTAIAVEVGANTRELFDIRDEADQVVMSWSVTGNISIPGASIFLPTGSIVAEGGQIVADTGRFSESLEVQSGGKLQIGDNLLVSPAGTIVEVAEPTSDAVLVARAGSHAFDGAAIKTALSSTNGLGYHLLAETLGATVFQVDSDGLVTSGGYSVTAGGVHVKAGGVTIDAGGMTVHGGLNVASGGLSVANDTLQIEAVMATVTRSPGFSALSGAINTSQYYGDVLKLECNASTTYNFVKATSNEEDIFTVSGSGDINSKGSITIGEGALIKGQTRLHSSLSMRMVQIPVGRSIVLPANASFVEITAGQDTDAPRTVKFPTEADGVSQGQIMILRNSAGYAFHLPSLPNGATVPFIFDGIDWEAINALSASTAKLSGVQELLAVTDLDIGEFSFSAGQLAASRQKQHTVPVFGVGGLLTGRDEFSFSDGMLSSPALQTQKLEGKIDCSGAVFNVPLIERATIRSAESITTKKLVLQSSQQGVTLLGLTKDGEVASSPLIGSDGALSLDNVRIRNLRSDVDLTGHRIRNVAELSSKSIAAETLHANSISTQALPRNRVLYIDGEGKIASTNTTVEHGVIVDSSVLERQSDFEDAQQMIDMTNKTLIRPRLLSPDISDILKLSVGTIQVMALRPGSIVGVDSSGSLESVLGVQVAGRTLSVDTLVANEIASDVDMGGHTLNNVKLGRSFAFSAPLHELEVEGLTVQSPAQHKDIATMVGLNEDGRVTKIDYVTATKERLKVDTMLHITQDSVIEGSITALGTVMGTGPYVDASDRRYKVDASILTNATSIVSNLQAYSYFYDNENYRHRKFPTKRQIGWMAQDVQQIIPEIVESDQDGYLSVAYARAVPVLAEALKALQHKVDALEQQLAKLQIDCKT